MGPLAHDSWCYNGWMVCLQRTWTLHKQSPLRSVNMPGIPQIYARRMLNRQPLVPHEMVMAWQFFVAIAVTLRTILLKTNGISMNTQRGQQVTGLDRSQPGMAGGQTNIEMFQEITNKYTITQTKSMPIPLPAHKQNCRKDPRNTGALK